MLLGTIDNIKQQFVICNRKAIITSRSVGVKTVAKSSNTCKVPILVLH